MDVQAAARRRRREAADRYRPDFVRLLLIAEAPPSDLERYFYFEHICKQDNLFRYVVQTVLDEPPARAAKAAQLARLREAGVFLIDLKTDPKVTDEPLDAHVPELVARAIALKPNHVITIKANVCDLCQEPLRAAGLDVADERVPFPGSGQQRRFIDGMARALRAAGWTS